MFIVPFVCEPRDVLARRFREPAIFLTQQQDTAEEYRSMGRYFVLGGGLLSRYIDAVWRFKDLIT